MTSNDNRLLNVMRFVASLMVIAGHIRTSLFRDYATEHHDIVNAIAYALTSLGNPAVMVFFALSGYWVGGSAFKSLLRRDFDFGRYLVRRLVRLWAVLIPALFLTLVVDIIGMATLSSADIYARPELYTGIPKNISHNILIFLGNTVFLQSLKITEYGYDKPLWSLSYEFWYYIAFPCLIILLMTGKSLRARCGALAGLALSLAIGGIPLLVLAPSWLLGAAAGAFPHALDGLRAKLGERAWGWVQLASALILVMAMCYQRAVPDGISGIILDLTSPLVILIMARDVVMPSRVLDLLSRLSHCTYSLYTTHMALVVIITAVVVPSFDDRWVLLSMHGLVLPLVMVLLLGIAWVFSLGTERKTDALRRWLIASWQHRRTA